MSPEDNAITNGDFSKQIPPSFNGREYYTSYRNNVPFWENLTTIATERQGAALIGRLHGEAKVSATTLSIEEVCSENGVERLLAHLDRSYGLDDNNWLNTHLSAFFNYSWSSELTVDQFIAGFNARLDRVACLKFNEFFKGHLLLSKSGLSPSDLNIFIAASAGSYEVRNLVVALRNAFTQSTSMDPHRQTCEQFAVLHQHTCRSSICDQRSCVLTT